MTPVEPRSHSTVPSRPHHLSFPTFAALLLGGALLLAAPGTVRGQTATPGGGRTGPPIAEPIDGSNDICTDFRLVVLDLGLFDLSFDIADEGWVWVHPFDPLEHYKSVAGLVESSHVARNDTPANHDSHDHGTDVIVDPEFIGLLSNANGPNNGDLVDSLSQFVDPELIELEWEIGVFPDVKGNSAPEAYFPRWAWPSIGDRVYANGNWIFDCGHPKDLCLQREPQHNLCIEKRSYYRSEIHPPRLVAAMRNQSQTLPKSGSTPVPVTATDLYLHGRAGYVNDTLQCGMKVLIGEGSCERAPHPHRPTPIADHYEFDICLPPQPNANAQVDWRFDAGPGNLVPTGTQTEPNDLDPDIDAIHPAPAGCANASQPMDTQTALHVTLNLEDSGIGPDDTYTRQIVAGWVDPPTPPLTHLNVGITNVDLHDSEDDDSLINPACSDDAEMTFFWANLDRAPSNEWIRFADFAPVSGGGHSVLNDYDPELLGHSYVDTPGAGYDFYLRNGEPFTLRTAGYDQDCYDQFFGDGHVFEAAFPYIWCTTSPFECFDGNNDDLDRIEAVFNAPDYGTDPDTGFGTPLVGTPAEPHLINLSDIVLISDYELNLEVQKVALTNEDTSDVQVSKECVPDTGKTFLCTIAVSNPGPGLPRNVVLEDTLAVGGAGASATMEAPVAKRADGTDFPVNPCTLTPPLTFSCNLGTVPVGGEVTVTVHVTTSGPGDYDDTATVTTDSTDPDTGNNSATSGITVVAIDIKPRQTPNAINPDDRGAVPVAILFTPDFNPVVVDPDTVCFGDSGTLSERNCEEVHRTGHREDVDKDRDIDLLFHFTVNLTGIDITDTSACLSGKTTANRTIMGCDAIKPVPKLDRSGRANIPVSPVR
jgi:hypothetical protein